MIGFHFSMISNNEFCSWYENERTMMLALCKQCNKGCLSWSLHDSNIVTFNSDVDLSVVVY